ncbi:MAG: hypothetical protein AABX40_04040 [Candidatus Hydrothermarchaeota archaeon]
MNRPALALLLSSALLYYYLGLLMPVPPAAYATRLVLDGDGTAVQRYTFVEEPSSDLEIDLEAPGVMRLYPPAAARALEYSIDGSPPRRVEPSSIEAVGAQMRVHILLDPGAEPGAFSLEANRLLKLAVLEVQLPQLLYRLSPQGYGMRHGYAEGLPTVTAYKQAEGTMFIGMEINAGRVPFLLLRYAALALLLGTFFWISGEGLRSRRRG